MAGRRVSDDARLELVVEPYSPQKRNGRRLYSHLSQSYSSQVCIQSVVIEPSPLLSSSNDQRYPIPPLPACIQASLAFTRFYIHLLAIGNRDCVDPYRILCSITPFLVAGAKIDRNLIALVAHATETLGPFRASRSRRQFAKHRPPRASEPGALDGQCSLSGHPPELSLAELMLQSETLRERAPVHWDDLLNPSIAHRTHCSDRNMFDGRDTSTSLHHIYDRRIFLRPLRDPSSMPPPS